MTEPSATTDGQAAPSDPGPRARRWQVARVAARVVALLAVAIIGGVLGASFAPSVTTQVGPLEAQVRVRVSLDPGVRVLLPPAGEVRFDTHMTPVAVEARIATVDLAAARDLIASPQALDALERTAPDDLRVAAAQAAALAGGFSLLGAVTLALLVYRVRWREVGASVASCAAVLVLLASTTLASFTPDRFAQPQFTGLLSQAPYVAVQAGGLLERLQSYRAGVGSIVEAVTTLYGMGGRLPVLGNADDDVAVVLHVSDIHMSPLGFDLTQRLVRDFGVEVVVDSGDITTWGTEVESDSLSWIGDLDVPYVFVRGNHDSARTAEIIARHPNAVVLDAPAGQVAEVAGLVMAGIGDPVFTPDAGRSALVSVPDVLQPQAGTPGPTPGPTPVPAPAGAAVAPREDVPRGTDPQVDAGYRLVDTISQWNAQHRDRPVTLATVHEPYAVPPLHGQVPLVLTGHFHSRDVSWRQTEDGLSTLVMREGSTGGAGISADFRAIEAGEPLPLSATLLHIARSGPRAGQVLAYDEVTVGGFGLASATVERTVLRPEDQTATDDAQDETSPTPRPEPAPG